MSVSLLPSQRRADRRRTRTGRGAGAAPVTTARLALPALLSLLAACAPGLRPAVAPSRPADPARGADALPAAAVPQRQAAPAAARLAPAADATVATGDLSDDVAAPDVLMRAAMAVFGDSTGLSGPYDGDSDGEAAWDIDVRSYETHERVEHYVQLYTGTAASRFAERLSRGTRYEPMIRAKLRAAGMPEDLAYLALIESGFDPDAYSRAAAVGLWQFMTATGREVGLRIDWWQDERRDPSRATDAAIRHFAGLQRQFGSLYLAAAAYNGGAGRVARGLSRFADELQGIDGDDRFFALAEQRTLPRETREYVPQLIAAALVAKTPDRFGLAVERQLPYVYDSVEVAAGTAVAAVATVAGLPVDTLLRLNRSLLQGTAPPDAAVWLRVPWSLGDSVRRALAAAPDDAVAGWRLETPARRETLQAFAERHGVRDEDVRRFNPRRSLPARGALPVGVALRVPTSHALRGVRDVPDPSIERYGRGIRLASGGVHVVRRGEVLGTIARRYGLSVARLKSLNGLRSDRIYAGQALVVRSGAGATTASRSTAAAGGATTHVVRRGEVLGTIARRYGLSVARLKALNGLSGDRIRVGQRLRVGAGTGATADAGRVARTADRQAARTHTVRSGESLSVIAQRYGTSVAAIKRANGLRSDRIRAGQRLRIDG